jgi:GH24 family phage-related lysozyme (muramidase)
LTKDQQFSLLKLIAPSYEQIVKKWIKVPLKQNEYDALVCFVYNPTRSFVPVANFINNGNIPGAMAEIKSRNPYSPGHTNYIGLENRRNKEVGLFENGVYTDVTEA